MRRHANQTLILGNVVLLLGVLALPLPFFAQSETITIKRHSRGGKNSPGELALLYGELDGHSAVLQCVLSHSDCHELPAGEYNIERLLEGEGSYKDCPNVDIYRLGADSFKEEPLGEYCLVERN
ncbi:MAG TPA: hypothetical protein VFB04_12840 [Terriglobales bacterium]|nr:hypothetical protein [Terriglobales bacterium]